MSEIFKQRERLADELADACRQVLAKEGFFFDRDSPTWQGLFTLFLTEIGLRK